MKLSELDRPLYTQLDPCVLAVLTPRVDGWCVYIGAVPGYRHDTEWHEVLHHGNKLQESVAEAIVQTYFHPPFEVDLPYAW